MKRHSDLPQKNMFFVGVLNWGPKKWKTVCGAKFQLIYIYTYKQHIYLVSKKFMKTNENTKKKQRTPMNN